MFDFPEVEFDIKLFVNELTRQVYHEGVTFPRETQFKEMVLKLLSLYDGTRSHYVKWLQKELMQAIDRQPRNLYVRTQDTSKEEMKTTKDVIDHIIHQGKLMHMLQEDIYAFDPEAQCYETNVYGYCSVCATQILITKQRKKEETIEW